MHACVCACECCMRAWLRVCMCTRGVRLHVSRLTFSSLVIRFSSRWIRNQGPAVYHQTPPPLSRQPPPIKPPAPAARGQPAQPHCPARPETTPHRWSATAPAIPLGCPRTELFLRGSPPHRPMNTPQPPVTANQRSHDFEYPPTTNLLPFLSFIYAMTGGPYGNVRCLMWTV